MASIEYIPPDFSLLHGTSKAKSRNILISGFNRGGRASYTGTAVNLTPLISLAYEYGTPEEGGAILHVRIKPGTAYETLNNTPAGFDFDEHFATTGVSALKIYSGNIWLVWDLSCISEITPVPAMSARLQLLHHIAKEGPQCGYNGLAGEYAAVLWKKTALRKPSLSRPGTSLEKAIRRCGYDLDGHWRYASQLQPATAAR